LWLNTSEILKIYITFSCKYLKKKKRLEGGYSSSWIHQWLSFCIRNWSFCLRWVQIASLARDVSSRERVVAPVFNRHALMSRARGLGCDLRISFGDACSIANHAFYLQSLRVSLINFYAILYNYTRLVIKYYVIYIYEFI